MKNIALALAALVATVAFTAPAAAQSVLYPCGKAVKFCNYNPWEAGQGGENTRNGAGKVSQTGGRTANSSKG